MYLMVKLPVISGQLLIKKLEDYGFTKVGQKGSHVKLRGIFNGTKRTVIVPLHNEIAPGTLSSILRQAGLSAEEIFDKN